MKKQREFFYGLKWSGPDHRDAKFAFTPPLKVAAPPEVDWRNLSGAVPPVKNQGQTNSCTGFSGSNAFQFTQAAQNPQKAFVSSAFFPYYNGRAIEGSTAQDDGAAIRDVGKGFAKKGTCRETLWPSADAKTVCKKPSVACYTEGQLNQLLQYNAVDQNLDHMKAVIAARRPLWFGIQVYTSFESKYTLKTGIVTMPKMFERDRGGHALWSCGYSDKKQWFIVQNSWGTDVNDKGFLYIPYNYVASRNLTSDIFTMTLVEEQ